MEFTALEVNGFKKDLHVLMKDISFGLLGWKTKEKNYIKAPFSLTFSTGSHTCKVLEFYCKVKLGKGGTGRNTGSAVEGAMWIQRELKRGIWEKMPWGQDWKGCHEIVTGLWILTTVQHTLDVFLALCMLWPKRRVSRLCQSLVPERICPGQFSEYLLNWYLIYIQASHTIQKTIL